MRPGPRNSSLLDNVKHLADLIGSVMGLPQAQDIEINGDIVWLAMMRHGVGPFLHGVVRSGSRFVTPELAGRLEQCYLANVREHARVDQQLQTIATLFERAKVRWLVLKGLPQARLLYADAHWRQSADIDVLVAPEDFNRAASILEAGHFTLVNPPLPADGLVRRSALRIFRDIALTSQGPNPSKIELHQRPFVTKMPVDWYLELTPRLTSDGEIPSPALGADLAFYMIAHGAISYWQQLKWVVDLVPLLAKLDDVEKQKIVNKASVAKARASFAASLILAKALFPAIALGPILPWLDDMQTDAGVQMRFARYARTIGPQDLLTKSPCTDRVLAGESAWLLLESPLMRARLLATAPLSSLVRTAVKLMYPPAVFRERKT